MVVVVVERSFKKKGLLNIWPWPITNFSLSLYFSWALLLIGRLLFLCVYIQRPAFCQSSSSVEHNEVSYTYNKLTYPLLGPRDMAHQPTCYQNNVFLAVSLSLLSHRFGKREKKKIYFYFVFFSFCCCLFCSRGVHETRKKK